MKSKLWMLAVLMLLGLSSSVWAAEEDAPAAADMNMDQMKMDMDNMPMGEMNAEAMPMNAEDMPMNAEGMPMHEMKAVDDAAAAPATNEVGNKICPVSGEKIVMEKKSTIEYQGKIYNLCCSMCKTDFQKKPEKYIEKLKAMEASGQEGTEDTDADGDHDGDK